MPIKEIQITGTVKVWYPGDSPLPPSTQAILRLIETLPENEWTEEGDGKIQQVRLIVVQDNSIS